MHLTNTAHKCCRGENTVTFAYQVCVKDASMQRVANSSKAPQLVGDVLCAESGDVQQDAVVDQV